MLKSSYHTRIGTEELSRIIQIRARMASQSYEQGCWGLMRSCLTSQENYLAILVDCIFCSL